MCTIIAIIQNKDYEICYHNNCKHKDYDKCKNYAMKKFKKNKGICFLGTGYECSISQSLYKIED